MAVKLSSVLIFLVLSLFFAPEISAAWTKYPGNPIIPAGNNACDNLASSSPSVIYDSGYKMWYQGLNNSGWSICYATSPDSITWTKHQTPLITTTSYGESDIQEVNEPSVIKTADNTYHIWFKDMKTGKFRIRYATSQNGLDWFVYPQPVLTGDESTWDKDGPTNPYVLFEGNTYHLWYLSGGSGKWKIGYAFSINGIDWQKSINNPLTLTTPGFVGGMSVQKINNQYSMWYHVGAGSNIAIYRAFADAVDQQTWSCGASCEVLSRTQNSFDSQHIVGPDVIKIDNNLMMFYGGNNGNKWQIGLATEQQMQSSKKPIVIIPGFFTSWNKNAILYNQDVPYSFWKLIPYIKEYEGLKQTLNNLGYEENKDWYIFPYDWRKSTENIVSDLSDFISHSNASNKELSLVGHSFGGLISRIYAQKNQSQPINKILTVGTPHQGTAFVYKPLEGGELDMQNSMVWLGEKLIIQLNKNGWQTDKDIINDKLPSLKDLFPTFNFLTDEYNKIINISDMHLSNNLLNQNNNSVPLIFSYLHTFNGNSINTLYGYTISRRKPVDVLLDLYPDGRPVSSSTQNGDGIILSDSSALGNNRYPLTLNHGELIYKKEAIKSILDSLSIGYEDHQIIEGQGTTVTPSLFFAMFSPAEMSVTYNNVTYQEADGLIFIDNAQPGNYRLNVRGIEKGKYKILVGKNTYDDSLWFTLEKEIVNNPPTSQIDTYYLSFDGSSQPLLSVANAYEDIIYNLNNLYDTYKIKQIFYAIQSIKQAQTFNQPSQLKKTKSLLLLAHSYLLTAKNILPGDNDKNKLLLSLEKIENLYRSVLFSLNSTINPLNLQKQLLNYNNSYSGQISRLQSLKNNTDISPKNSLILKVDEHLQKAQQYFNQKDYAATEIILKTTDALLQDIKHIK